MLEQELNAYRKTVVDTIQDGLMVLDKAGTIISVNKALASAFQAACCRDLQTIKRYSKIEEKNST